MPESPTKNEHTHFFALLGDDGAELDANDTHASGLTIMSGTMGQKQHAHKWHLMWDRDKGHYIVEFGPGGDDSHSHPTLKLKRSDF